GRIEIVDDTLQKITITNTTQNITTTSDAYGYFSIAAKVNDTISFTSEWTVPKNIIIDKNLLIRLQPVYLSSAATELQPIHIRHFDENFLNLKQAQRIISQEQYINPNMDFVAIARFIVNAFRKKSNHMEVTKKAIFEAPKKVWIQEDRLLQIPCEYYTQEIGIPEGYVDTFVYFLSEAPDKNQWLEETDEEKLKKKLLEKKELFFFYLQNR